MGRRGKNLMRHLIRQNIFKSPADIFIHKIDKIRLSPSSFIILNDSELKFILTFNGLDKLLLKEHR